MKQNHHLSAAELLKKVLAVLDQMFNNHVDCDEKWCHALSARSQGKCYTPSSGHQLRITANSEIYEILNTVFKEFSSVQLMAMYMHPWNTQTNEVMNRAISLFA